MYNGIWGQAHPCITVFNFWPPTHGPVGKFSHEGTTIQAQAKWNVNDRCTGYWKFTDPLMYQWIKNGPSMYLNDKNGPSMYLNDKKWPASMYRLKQAHPSMYRIFEKKRDPLMYLAAWFCDPYLRHIPITTFVLSTPPPPGVVNELTLQHSQTNFEVYEYLKQSTCLPLLSCLLQRFWKLSKPLEISRIKAIMNMSHYWIQYWIPLEKGLELNSEQLLWICIIPFLLCVRCCCARTDPGLANCLYFSVFWINGGCFSCTCLLM